MKQYVPSSSRVGAWLLLALGACTGTAAWAQSDSIQYRNSYERWNAESGSARGDDPQWRDAADERRELRRKHRRDFRRNDDRQYLFHNGSVGAFGTVLFEFGQIQAGSNIGAFSGGGGALVFNDRFFVGGYGQRLLGGLQTIPQQVSEFAGENSELEFGHGGLWFGGQFLSHRLVHPSFQLKLGWGGARWKDAGGNVVASDRFFLVQPAVGIQVNVASWVRVNLEGGYRVLTGLNLRGIGENDLNGLSGHVGFSFGGWD